MAMKKSWSKLGSRGMASSTLQKVLLCHYSSDDVLSMRKLSVKMTPNRKATSTPKTTDICGYTPNREPNSLGVSYPM